MNRLLIIATAFVLAFGLGLPVTASAQTAPAAERAHLLPGCPLPSSRLIAAASPFDVELRLTVGSSGAVAAAEVSKSSGRLELDAAFAGAALACRFAPLSERAIAGRSGVVHRLAYRYPGGPSPLGMDACFATDYPPLARRREEEGTNSIHFRVALGETKPEVRLVRSSGSGSLDAEALARASSCLDNAVVRAELIPGQWYLQNIMWVMQ